MGLNLSNHQIVQELSLSESDVYEITDGLRGVISQNQKEVTISGEIKCDKVYVVGEHKAEV